MSQTHWIELAIAAVCVVLAAVGTATEAAFTSLSRVRAQALVDDGRRGAKRLLDMVEDRAPYVNTSLFVRLVLEVAATVLVAVVFFETMSATWERVLYPVLVMVAVSFILLGVAPRTLGRQHADSLALRTCGVLSALTTVFGPVSALMVVIGNVLTPGRGFADGPFSSEAELRELVDMAEERELIEDDERKMIHSVFELGDTIVREVMVPRTEVVWIERDKTLRQAVSVALRSGFSRIPVIVDDVDDVVGILYLKDLIRRVHDAPGTQKTATVESVMRPPTFCPDSKPVDELLREMQLTRNHVVIVIDEFGGTAGLATIEDILEELVGEIVDEYDHEVPPVTDLGDGRYRLSARLSISDLAELFGVDADDEDVETVLGLIGKLSDKVPVPGASVVWEGIELVAERGTGRRPAIRTVLASRAVEPGEAEEIGEDE